MVNVSITEPCTQVISSRDDGGPQIDLDAQPGRRDVDAKVGEMHRAERRARVGAGPRTLEREPPPPAVMCVTPWIGWNRS